MSGQLARHCELHHLGIVTTAAGHDKTVTGLRRLFGAELEDEVTADLGRCKELAVGAGARLVGENHDHGGWAEFFVDPQQVGGALLHWMQPVQRT